MKKTSSLALVAAALVSVVGFSLPAMAEGEGDPMVPDNASSVLSSLRSQGIAASDLQLWAGKIRATVTAADGSTSFQYFDADSLRPVGDNLTTGSIGGSGNVQRDAQKPDLTSLSAPPVDY
jgi:hypothetical protein